VGVPAPGGMREVASLAGDLFSSPLSRGGPLWEIWVLEGLEGGHVGLLVKVHHALMDGIRGARLFEALFDLEPDAPLARSDGERVATDRAPSRLRMLAGSGVFLAGTPLRALHLGAEMVSAGGRLARVLASREGRAAALPFRAPRTLLNRPLTSRRAFAFAFAFASVSLEDMRTVKRAFGVTMNDVALALSAHVLRRYLVERDDLPESALLAQIPVGVHRDGDASGGNFVAATGASLHTDIAEPVERLAAIHESMQSAKAMQAALGDDIVIDALAVFPPAVISAGLGLYRGLDLAAIHPPIFNAIISNVPGPQIPLYSCGARLAATYTLGPLLLGCGINITLMSYQGRVDFGVAVCPDVVEEPWELADGIPDSLAVLRKAADA
ncbi:MAG: wax ester/triacylglycerol synthase family O-acyltransferase, partial [Acidimicrobiia bacterium]